MKYKFIPVDNNLDKALAFANTLDPSFIKNTQRIKQKDFYIPTLDVVEKFQNEGWEINGVSEHRNKRTRKIENNYVQMIHPDFSIKNKKGKDEAYTSLTISNSCSGKQPLEMGLGAYRMVCANGLIQFDKHAEEEKVKHTEINYLNLDRFISSINGRSQDIIQQLNSWKEKDMTSEEMHKLAKNAAKLRFNEDDEDFNPYDLLRVNRAEDEGNDMWAVFNRIQENLTYDIKDKKTDIWLNKQLYGLADRELAYV
ncbi:DUF945 domain-containing protein [bacterium]|nr:DUF945 domain-containing protein [bacterium]MDB4319910.1 DUF945 domain-containing protein [bacterium]